MVKAQDRVHIQGVYVVRAGKHPPTTSGNLLFQDGVTRSPTAPGRRAEPRSDARGSSSKTRHRHFLPDTIQVSDPGHLTGTQPRYKYLAMLSAAQRECVSATLAGQSGRAPVLET
ncbi:hypothetical protein OF83DRAFT_580883 [Amylostereum chailletii]|nr:hypothetical protein OF83DRAFT_580883 [Amylostereum chailletii]